MRDRTLAASRSDRSKGRSRKGGRHDRGRPSMYAIWPTPAEADRAARAEELSIGANWTLSEGGRIRPARGLRPMLPTPRRGPRRSCLERTPSSPGLLSGGQGVGTGSPPIHSPSMRCSREDRARVRIADRRRPGLRRGDGPGSPPSRPIAETSGDPGAQPPAISDAILQAGSSSGGVAASVRAAQAACEVAR